MWNILDVHKKCLFKKLMGVSKFSTSAPGVRRVCASAPGPCTGCFERREGMKSLAVHLSEYLVSFRMQSSAIPHHREQSAAGDLKRDADILIPSWEAGCGLAIYMGITHPYPPGQVSTVGAAAATTAAAGQTCRRLAPRPTRPAGRPAGGQSLGQPDLQAAANWLSIAKPSTGPRKNSSA